MANITLATILDAVKTLTLDEQRQLRSQLDQRLAHQDDDAGIRAFHEALLASGLVTTIKTPRVDHGGPRRLIEVKGKPISETIIEERG